jgi:hypothetical protein
MPEWDGDSEEGLEGEEVDTPGVAAELEEYLDNIMGEGDEDDMLYDEEEEEAMMMEGMEGMDDMDAEQEFELQGDEDEEYV